MISLPRLLPKMCNTCTNVKSEDNFHKRKASIDGLSSRCKSCQRAYDKARSKDTDREEARRAYAQTDDGRLAGNRAKAEYRKRNPLKSRAHCLVYRAIKGGKLTMLPCEVCQDKETQAHHDDYSKPLNIRWLCSLHHIEWHKTNKAING